MPDYLQYLNQQLAEGLSRTSAEFRRLHGDWIRARQNADGGWSGREGDSDLYYTGFALRGLAVLDELTPEVATRAAGYLKGCLSAHASVVDFFSFLYSCLLVQVAGAPDVLEAAPADWPERVANLLDQFRTPDHGYNKNPGAASGSTYHTFLVGLCYQLLGRNYPHPEEAARFARSRRREDGGFVEVSAMRRSGTNPTAAGVGILHLVHGLDLPREETEPTLEYLVQMPSDEGGLRANDRVPLADLLSTFTGLWTLHLLGGLDRVPTKPAQEYAQMLARPGGGFLGGLWDEAADVEYTFYGLGTVALMNSLPAQG